MTRRLFVWLAGSAVLLTVLILVGCVVSTSVTPIKVAEHPGYTAGTACDAADCHDTYKHREPYLGACENCHTLDSWTPAVYSHEDSSFDNGMHPLIGCAMCHTEGEPLPAPACASCHEAPHGGLETCVGCHTTTAWGMRKPLPEAHVSLLGGHKDLECFDCHEDAKPPAKPRQCTSCHGTNHGGLTNCQSCHDPETGWEPKDGWSHDSFYKIVGKHKALECTQCHKSGRFAGTPRVCVGCHGKEHGGLTDCASCHTPAGFTNATFRHSSVFPLTGRHAKLACTKCHTQSDGDGVVKFAMVKGNGSHACVDCHGAQHGGLTDCASCHTTASFSAATFRHETVFPRVGQHATLACSACHINGEFTVLGTRCVDCHGEKHGNQTQCQQCHTPVGFDNVPTFTDHPIALGGDHADTTECTRCHPASGPDSGPVFNAAMPSCASCHGAGGSADVLVPHVGPADCYRCHVPVAWSQVSKFAHPRIDGFGEISPHASEDFFGDYGPYPAGCATCHPGSGSNPDFTGFSCTAAGCHV